MEDDFYDEDDYGEGGPCYRCGGARYVVICIDDLCANSDHCMHGDGEADCPVCNKDGSLDWNY